jgi:outer membrane lipoprotein-sorting protein
MNQFNFLVRGIGLVGITFVLFLNAANANNQNVGKHKLTADQIVNNNIKARGGLNAWRQVNTLALSGNMEAGGKKNTDLPFVMTMQRPRMSRLEIRFQDKTAVQVFDGEHGWKVRPFLGRDAVEPFSPDEARLAEAWAELDGPLIDYAKKGSSVSLAGTESVEGHLAYKLKVTLKNRDERYVWVDAENFLERKIEGDPRKIDGKLQNVAIFYRDFKIEKGLMIPSVFETVVEGGKQTHKLNITQIVINQPVTDKLFAKPQMIMAGSVSKNIE